jgi:cell division septum initiation protein DivIVA
MGIIKLMPRLPKQDTELLEAALIGFQQKRDQLEQKIADLRSQIARECGLSAGSRRRGCRRVRT